MSIKIEDYYSRPTFQKMKAFADQHETPFVVIDTATIDKAYDDLRAGFDFAKVYYAVKANPAVEIIGPAIVHIGGRKFSQRFL
jgi:ornithine decarboxylase